MQKVINKTLQEYQDGCLETWSGENRPIRSVLGLCGEAGEVGEVLKKQLRGDYGGRIAKPKLVKELGDTLYYLVMVAHEHGISVDDIMTSNYNKLKDRKERGVIKGSGDER